VLGLYVHIPFCARKCNYCDFYSVPSIEASLLDRYLDALFLEAEKYSGMAFDTLYVGGGTPSILGPDRLETLMAGLSRRLGLKRLPEASIEVNPESASPEFMRMARSLGFNRLSIGVQSLNDDELRKAGRIHSSDAAITAMDNAVRCGFDNISADIIVGLPGQTSETLSNTLGQLTGRGLTHISAYCLSIEESTPFAVSPPPDLLDDDAEADLFETAALHLAGHGFTHYEISNFALPGKECLHNLNYWRGGEYVGLGPAAASNLGSRRMKNAPCLDGYLQNPLAIEVESEELSSGDRMAEEAMLRLRLLKEGLDLNDLTIRYPLVDERNLVSRLDKMTGEKMLLKDGVRYRLPPGGVLTSNRVFVNVIN
jgi:oxygen-independent coproporphyrinogen III oxidase